MINHQCKSVNTYTFITIVQWNYSVVLKKRTFLLLEGEDDIRKFRSNVRRQLRRRTAPCCKWAATASPQRRRRSEPLNVQVSPSTAAMQGWSCYRSFRNTQDCYSSKTTAHLACLQWTTPKKRSVCDLLCDLWSPARSSWFFSGIINRHLLLCRLFLC